MSIDIETTTEKLNDGVRAAFAISGLAAVAIGVAILVWPGKTAIIVAALLGVYSLIAGLFYIGVGISSQSKTGWSKVGHILLGALYIIAGIILFGNLGAAVAVLQVVIGILIGSVWLVEGVVALTTIGDSPSKGLTIFYGLISIFAGLALLFAPALYAGILWWLLGAMMLTMGLIQLYRAFAFRRVRVID